MENIKNTLTYLNSRVWYRLTKVLYNLIFLGVITIGIFAIVTNWVSKIDIEKTKAVCYSPDDRFFTYPETHLKVSLKSAWINYLSNDSFQWDQLNYKDYVSNDSLNALRITLHCMNEVNKDVKDYKDEYIDYNTDAWKEMLMWQKSYELRFWKNNIISNKKAQEKLSSEEEVIFAEKLTEYDKYLNDSYGSQRLKWLDFSLSMFDIQPVYSYRDFIVYIIWLFFWVFIAFEIIRRVFYYIIIGTFFPKKEIS